MHWYEQSKLGWGLCMSVISVNICTLHFKVLPKRYTDALVQSRCGWCNNIKASQGGTKRLQSMSGTQRSQTLTSGREETFIQHLEHRPSWAAVGGCPGSYRQLMKQDGPPPHPESPSLRMSWPHSAAPEGGGPGCRSVATLAQLLPGVKYISQVWKDEPNYRNLVPNFKLGIWTFKKKGI